MKVLAGLFEGVEAQTPYGGISDLLTGPTALATSTDPVAAAKIAVEDGRLSGTSLASIDGILARAMHVVVAA